jgi:putative FmdB family regulatory protein
MPIYEYRCNACRHELEAIQKFSDAPLVACPQCGKDALVKLVSAAGFQLKGSGWYQTDFRNSGGKQAVKPSAEGDAAKVDGAKSEDAKGDGAKSEPGSAATAETSPVKSGAHPSTPAAPSTPASA